MSTYMYPLKSFRGIDQHLLDSLSKSGIRYSSQLLRACQTEEQRLQLAQHLHVSLASLTDLLCCVDLVQLRSIGGDFARLLLAAEVRSCHDLASQTPEILTLKLKHLHEQHRLAYHAPTPIQVRSWISQAQTFGGEERKGDVAMVVESD